jgi:HAD superfamily hydrolase (TIGR01484 family)
MYKALVTDLDGTALPIGSDGHEVSKQTRSLIRKATKAGYKITCATGREWDLARPVIQALGLSSPCIIAGGTRIADPQSGRVLWEKPMEPGDAEKVLKIYKKYAGGGKLITESLINRPELSTVEHVQNSELFVYLLAVKEDTAIAIANQINELPSVVAHLTPSWYGQTLVDIHATHTEATKEHAINVWQTMNGVHIQETIGMGDSGNDIPIFQASALKIAVSDATPELLQLADHIVPANETDALVYVMQKFLFAQS